MKRLAALLPLAWAVSGCSGPSDTEVSFSRDIAPLVWEHCSGCHRPGEVAPFSLLDYDEVAARARDIATVTRSGFMPPWQPEPGPYAFAFDRRLDESQIALFERWHDLGAPPGDTRDLPAPPVFPTGWQLGEPDLVVTFNPAFEVPAGGVDVFRNLVAAVPVTRSRWVEAIELRPGNPRVVHHAIMRVDRTPASRRLAELEPEQPGFGGMTMGQSVPPDGHFVGWTPGRAPRPPDEGLAWRVDPGSDFVLQLHLLPSGRPEAVLPAVGLHFADRPPLRRPSILTLYSNRIDIPAGATDHRVDDSLVLPVPATLLGVYPHAHYLGKRIEGSVELPDGSSRTFISIPDWDFNWQDEYRFAETVELPAGSRLVMRTIFDNSAANVRNPNFPPRRVVYGNRSTDEMASMTLQLQTRSERERSLLEAAEAEAMIRKEPRNWAARNNLGQALLRLGRAADAERELRASLELTGANDEVHYNLGLALAAQGRTADARTAYREALRLNPYRSEALNNLGKLLLDEGRPDEAVVRLNRAIELNPGLAQAHYNLGVAHATAGRAHDAIRHFEAVIELDPTDAQAHSDLGVMLNEFGRTDEAIARLRAAVDLDPDLALARANLERLLDARR